MSYTTQDFGPWNLFEDFHQSHENPAAEPSPVPEHKILQSKSLSMRKQVKKQKLNTFLPELQKKNEKTVLPTLKQQIVQSMVIKQQKQPKQKNPLKMNQVQIKLLDKELKSFNQSQQPTKKSSTITIDPITKNSFKKIMKISAKKQKTNYGSFNVDPQLDQKLSKLKEKRKVSMVDFNAQYVNDSQQKRKEGSCQLSKRSNHEFSKKRSLLEIIKYIKNSGQNIYFTSQDGNHKKRYSSLQNRGKKGLCDVINISMKSQLRYAPCFPCFSTIKLNNFTKKQ